MTALPERSFSLEVYLALEETGEGKHEYYQGMIYDMTGASEPHSLIAANIIASLRPQLRGKVCKVHAGDLHVMVEATGLYTYPDVLVVCGAPHFVGARREMIDNPTLIVEVLSPSTEQYDRGKKFQNYRTIATLCDYLLIAQDATRVEQFVRQEDNRWLLSEYNLTIPTA